jgi:hypothetical protein
MAEIDPAFVASSTGVGLRELNLGKTNPRVSLFIRSRFVFAPSLSDSFIFLTLTRLVVVIKFVNFRFALFTPPLGNFQISISIFLLNCFIPMNFRKKGI